VRGQITIYLGQKSVGECLAMLVTLREIEKRIACESSESRCLEALLSLSNKEIQ
jgi:hypothetical protein